MDPSTLRSGPEPKPSRSLNQQHHLGAPSLNIFMNRECITLFLNFSFFFFFCHPLLEYSTRSAVGNLCDCDCEIGNSPILFTLFWSGTHRYLFIGEPTAGETPFASWFFDEYRQKEAPSPPDFFLLSFLFSFLSFQRLHWIFF